MLKASLKLLSAAVLTVSFAGCPSLAEEVVSPEKAALIREVLDATRATRLAQMGYDLSLSQALKGMNVAVALRIDNDPKLNPDEKAEAKKSASERTGARFERFKEIIAEKVNISQLVTDSYLQVYSDYFTVEQLKTMLEFYQSPTGQHALDVMPTLVDNATKLVNASFMPKLKEASVQFEQEIKDGKI